MKPSRLFFKTVVIAAVCLTLNACTQPVDVSQNLCPVEITMSLPTVADTLSEHTVHISEVTITFNDLNMSRQSVVTPDTFAFDTAAYTVRFTTKVRAGYYDISATASMQLDTISLRLHAYIQSVSVTGNPAGTAPVPLHLDANVVQDRSTDFIFAELSTSGTQTPQGKNYVGDSYFVLYNNTDDTLYADGVVLLESKLKNSQKFGRLDPYFISESFGADAIYRIPGSGKDHPVAPGGTVLLVDNAQNHKQMNPASFDLSHADFEWYDQSTSATVTDIDNPDIPNMDKLYCYTLTIWLPNRQGNTSFALARFPEGLSDSAYLTDYRLQYDYTLITNAGNFDMTANCYRVPNEWILDCVNTCPRTSYQWTVTAPALDAGWTYIGDIGADKQRFGKCVRRRERIENGEPVLLSNGRSVLQDTNNSTMDFLPAQPSNPEYFRK